MPNYFKDCDGCQDRTYAGRCHSTCKKYKEALLKQKESNERRLAGYILDSYEFNKIKPRKKK